MLDAGVDDVKVHSGGCKPVLDVVSVHTGRLLASEAKHQAALIPPTGS